MIRIIDLYTTLSWETLCTEIAKPHPEENAPPADDSANVVGTPEARADLSR
ncbi:MAG: hypothetical protein HY901_07150 [Deltaproteobacteria bacterium]|nr:hypothetical protein [Deltaproteobacteria bacterium]